MMYLEVGKVTGLSEVAAGMVISLSTEEAVTVTSLLVELEAEMWMEMWMVMEVVVVNLSETVVGMVKVEVVYR